MLKKAPSSAWQAVSDPLGRKRRAAAAQAALRAAAEALRERELKAERAAVLRRRGALGGALLVGAGALAAALWLPADVKLLGGGKKEGQEWGKAQATQVIQVLAAAGGGDERGAEENKQKMKKRSPERVNFAAGFQSLDAVRQAVARVIRLDVLQHLNGVEGKVVQFEDRLTDMQQIRQDLTHAVQEFASTSGDVLGTLEAVYKTQKKVVQEFSQKNEEKSWLEWLWSRNDEEESFRNGGESLMALFFVPGDIYSVLLLQQYMPLKVFQRDKEGWRKKAQEVYEMLEQNELAYGLVMTFAFILSVLRKDNFKEKLYMFKDAWETAFSLDSFQSNHNGPTIDTSYGWGPGWIWDNVGQFTTAKQIMNTALTVNQYKFEDTIGDIREVLADESAKKQLSTQLMQFGTLSMLNAIKAPK